MALAAASPCALSDCHKEAIITPTKIFNALYLGVAFNFSTYEIVILTFGFFTVSSTLRIRQAASVAAFIALICEFGKGIHIQHSPLSKIINMKNHTTFTTDGSHTKLANESAIPPVFMSTPYGAPSPMKRIKSSTQTTVSKLNHDISR